GHLARVGRYLRLLSVTPGHCRHPAGAGDLAGRPGQRGLGENVVAGGSASAWRELAPCGRKKQIGEARYGGGSASCGRIFFLCICVRWYRAPPCFCSCTCHWTPPAAISSIPAATRVTNPSGRCQRQLGGSFSSRAAGANCVA